MRCIVMFNQAFGSAFVNLRPSGSLKRNVLPLLLLLLYFNYYYYYYATVFFYFCLCFKRPSTLGGRVIGRAENKTNPSS